jgi:MFS family permease
MWGGNFVSNIGTWMQQAAQQWLVYKLSGDSALWLGITAAAGDVPMAAFLVLGGLLADRFDRRKTLILTNAASGILALILAVLTWTGTVRVWCIVCLAFGTGMADALRIPAGQSLIPNLVGEEDVPNALALSSMQFNASRVLGPALGGLVLVTLGAGASFALNALSFLGVIVAMVAMVNPPPRGEVKETMGQSLLRGLGYVRRRADLVMMLSLLVIGGVLGAPLSRMLAAIASEVYHGGKELFTILLVCYGVGAVIGAATVAYGARHGRMAPWRSFPVMIALGGCTVALGLGGPVWLAGALVMAAGAGFTGSMVRISASSLNSTPHDMQGRVSSFQVLCGRAGAPVGSFGAGYLAQRLGLARVLYVMGASLIAVVLCMMVAARRWKITYQGDQVAEGSTTAAPEAITDD